MSEREARARQIIRSHVAWSAGSGLVPFPWLSLAAVTGVQLDMLKQLCALYEVPYAQERGQAWLAALTGTAAARVGANALKAIPGLGMFIGGLSVAAMSAASTYAVGNVAMRHLEEAGELSNLKGEEAKAAYESALDEGKRVASAWMKKKTDAEDPFVKLERLAALRDKGVVSVEEFLQAKRELLDSFGPKAPAPEAAPSEPVPSEPVPTAEPNPEDA